MIHKIDSYRKLCIQKDLNELRIWFYAIESFNRELDHATIIEKQLLKISIISHTILKLRRKNVLIMANLCKYEQELNRELEYGTTEYNIKRLKIHEQKREHYLNCMKDYDEFKNQFYLLIRKYKRS